MKIRLKVPLKGKSLLRPVTEKEKQTNLMVMKEESDSVKRESRENIQMGGKVDTTQTQA